MSDLVPQELWVDIFSRLNVNTLLRIRCVCKLWYVVISDYNFISIHLNRTKNTKSDNHALLLRHFTDTQWHVKEHYLLLRDDQTLGGQTVELEFPLKTRSKYHFRVVGSCNGVVCLSDELSDSDLAYDIILWNPSIRKFVTLPKPRVSNVTHGSYMFLLGFGADHMTDDYKVVRVAYIKGRNGRDLIPPEVEVYRLSSGSWRSLSTGATPYGMFGYTWTQAFFNGAVHWIGYDPCGAAGNRNLVVSFDMSDEVFGEVMLPKDLAAQCGEDLSVVVFEKLLSLFHYEPHAKKRRCSVWVMKQYGVVDSWIKVYTIDLQEGIQKTLGFRKNGEVLLTTRRGKLISYDPNTLQMKNLGIRGPIDSFYIDAYMESLVLLGAGGGQLGGQPSSFDGVTDKGAEENGVEDHQWPKVLNEPKKNREEVEAFDLRGRSGAERFSDCPAENCEEWDKALAIKFEASVNLFQKKKI